MQALRFLALATVGFVLIAGTFLWYQQIARLESEAVRVLDGPEIQLEAGATARWELNLDGATIDEAWMDAQRQPHLSLPLPDGAGAVRVRVSARYGATKEFAEAAAFLTRVGADGAEAARGSERVAEASDGLIEFGPLWLSYLQPLVVDLEVLDPGSGTGAVVRPRLAGEVSADYAFARELDHTLFVVFLVLGIVGVVGLVLVERGLDRERAALLERASSDESTT